MESPHRWIFVVVITYLSFKKNAISQHVDPGNIMVREKRDCTGNPTVTDMYNSVLNIAAANGVLADLIPMLQSQQIADNLQRFSYPQDIMIKPLSVVPMPNSLQEPIIISSQPMRPPAPNQNILVATPLSCGSSGPSNMLPGVLQTLLPPAPPPSNSASQIVQPFPLENYSVYTPNVGVVRQTPIMLQPQYQFNEVNPYIYNQIAELLSSPEDNMKPLNLSTLPPQNLPTINTCLGTLEISTNVGTQCLPQSSVLTSDGQQIPLNLQINVPTPSVPAPRITVVSTSPSNSPVPPPPSCPEYPANLPPYQYPQLPIMLEGNSKSSWRNWLPIILLALFSDRGSSNDGCCRCCCSCNGGSGNIIPIPYPIPIPINNPIINCPNFSHSREYRDDGDEDDDRN